MRSADINNSFTRRFFCLLLIVSTSAATAKDDPNDCSYKPILGTHLAQGKDDSGFEFSRSSKDGIETKKMFFPIYGHWCGPGYPREGENPVPYDALDSLCKQHDQCYVAKGYSDCSCDQSLISAVQQAKREGKHMVSCKKNGRKTRMENPSYGQVEWYFTKEMAKRNCPQQ